MPDQPLLLIVEDDAVFARTLQRSFERRGYEAVLAASPADVDQVLADRTPQYAVVDLKLAQASGLSCVETLHAHDPDMIIIVLTGYASIATAVQSIKLGATSYLAKPANTDEIEAAFGQQTGDAAAELAFALAELPVALPLTGVASLLADVHLQLADVSVGRVRLGRVGAERLVDLAAVLRLGGAGAGADLLVKEVLGLRQRLLPSL